MSPSSHCGLCLSWILRIAIVLLVGLCALTGPLGAQVLEYKFDNSSASTGSDATALTLGNGATYTASGGGVSGLAGDYALDLSAASGMGSAVGTTPSPEAKTTGAIASLSNLTAFTFAGWFKTSSTTPLGGSARIFDAGNVTLFNSPSAGTLTLSVNSGTAVSTAAYAATQEWMFIAVTYDSVASTATFYLGGVTGNLTAVGTYALAKGAATFNAGLDIGNRASDSLRPFDGYVDDVQIYNTALSASALEDIRLSAIPEPFALPLLGLGMLLIAVKSRRKY